VTTGEQTLRYRLPAGQDAAPLIASLRMAGFEASPDTVAGQSRVLISSGDGGGVDRETVRSVIEESNRTSVFDGGGVRGRVQFEGEGGA
jgi:hypothetical protein